MVVQTIVQIHCRASILIFVANDFINFSPDKLLYICEQFDFRIKVLVFEI